MWHDAQTQFQGEPGSVPPGYEQQNAPSGQTNRETARAIVWGSWGVNDVVGLYWS